MKSLCIEKTEYSPKVNFTPSENIFELLGTSRPEDVIAFYEPIRQAIEKYVAEYLSQNSDDKIKQLNYKVVFNLNYINSASSKYILQIIDNFKRLHTAGANIEIVWHYEDMDDQILEDGEDLSDVIRVPFTFVGRK